MDINQSEEHLSNEPDTDDIEAVKKFRFTAEKGKASTQYTLACMYYSGHGVQQNHEEALKWFQMVVENPDSEDYALRDSEKMILQCKTRSKVKIELEQEREWREKTIARLAEEFGRSR